MKRPVLMTFAQAKALTALCMASDPSPLSNHDDRLVRGVLDNAANEFGFDSWVELYHADAPSNAAPPQVDEAGLLAIRLRADSMIAGAESAKQYEQGHRSAGDQFREASAVLLAFAHEVEASV